MDFTENDRFAATPDSCYYFYEIAVIKFADSLNIFFPFNHFSLLNKELLLDNLPQINVFVHLYWTILLKTEKVSTISWRIEPKRNLKTTVFPTIRK